MQDTIDSAHQHSPERVAEPTLVLQVVLFIEIHKKQVSFGDSDESLFTQTSKVLRLATFAVEIPFCKCLRRTHFGWSVLIILVNATIVTKHDVS